MASYNNTGGQNRPQTVTLIQTTKQNIVSENQLQIKCIRFIVTIEFNCSIIFKTHALDLNLFYNTGDPWKVQMQNAAGAGNIPGFMAEWAERHCLRHQRCHQTCCVFPATPAFCFWARMLSEFKQITWNVQSKLTAKYPVPIFRIILRG